MTRRIVLAGLLLACHSDPPPRAEATPQTSPSAAESAKAAYDEQFSHGIALGNVDDATNKPPADAGVANGRIPPDEVQRVVRADIARIRACYERVLAKEPALEGRVAVKFVIDLSGGVASASPHPSTTMTNTGVVSCVTSVFKAMKFPAPEGGVVTVVYPFDFRPGG